MRIIYDLEFDLDEFMWPRPTGAAAMSNIDEIRGRKHCYGVQAEKDFDALLLKLHKLQEDYDYAAHHADRGWGHLKTAVEALVKIASPGEGRVVTSSFDEPEAAKIARAALWELPSAGAYEGDLDMEPPQ